MASKFATPLNTGVKSGPGYHPKFHSGGPYVNAKQPSAITPQVTTPYFTDTEHKIKRKLIKTTPFEYPTRKPFGTDQPVHVGGYHGLYHGVNWKNSSPQADKPVVNATQNAMAIRSKEKTESMPVQCSPPEIMNYKDKSNESMKEYFQNLSDERLRQKVQLLQAKGYSNEEIVKQINKLRESDIEKAIKDPTNTEKLMTAQIAQLTSVSQAITGLNYRNEGGGVPQRRAQPPRGSGLFDSLTLEGTRPSAAGPLLGTREHPIPMFARTRVTKEGIYIQEINEVHPKQPKHLPWIWWTESYYGRAVQRS